MDAKTMKLSNKSCDGGDGGGVDDIQIRTLHVSPVNADMSDQIKCYFQRFGVVNFVEIEEADTAGSHFGLVEFRSVEAAAAVLSSSATHAIGDCDVQVKAAEPWLQPDHILNALNDDCLRLILMELNQSDLTNAANVCIRFNQQAKSVFSTEFKKLDLTVYPSAEVENSLKTFGSLAQSVEITGFKSSIDIEILQMIIQYCTPALKELTFNEFDFDCQAPNIDLKFDLALSKLERLAFVNCELGNTLNTLPSACVELKILNIEKCFQSTVLPVWAEFSKLQELRLIDCYGLNNKFKDDIIAMNSNLLKISVIETVFYQNADSSLQMIRTIAKNHPNLLELEFQKDHHHPTDDFFENFRCFTSLKVLKLNLNSNDNSLAVPLKILTANAIPIEHLQLCNESINIEAITAMLQMKQLTVLELKEVDGLTDEHMIMLAKGLGSQLEELRLVGSTAENLTTIGLKRMLPFATKLTYLTLKSSTIIIDTDDYKAMVATVQKRPGKTSLSIELARKGWPPISAAEKVRMESGILTIAEKIEYVWEDFWEISFTSDSDDSE